VALLGQEAGGRCAAVLGGRRQGIGGGEGWRRWRVGCVVGVATLLGREGSGGHGPAGTALPGQEGSGDGIDYKYKDSG
jgi:hypothetical protein